jgi:hypothetical protein
MLRDNAITVPQSIHPLPARWNAQKPSLGDTRRHAAQSKPAGRYFSARIFLR